MRLTLKTTDSNETLLVPKTPLMSSAGIVTRRRELFAEKIRKSENVLTGISTLLQRKVRGIDANGEESFPMPPEGSEGATYWPKGLIAS